VPIALGPLPLEDSRTLARSAGAPEVPAVERAEGNPLFIVELARYQAAGKAELPLTLRGVIAARIDELPASDRDLLQRAGVAGETFTVRDAALLADREPAEVAGALGRLVHLLYVTQVDGAYRFHHALVRDVAYGRLTATERMALHARYAEEGADPEDVEALAHHWWEALRPPDAEWVWAGSPRLREMRRAALHAQLAAGSRLLERLSFERARETYEQALALASEDTEVAEVEAALGDAYHANALGDESWDHRLRAIEAFRRAGAEVPARLYADLIVIPTFNWGYFRALPTHEKVIELLSEAEAASRRQADAGSLARVLVERAHFTNDPAALAEALRSVEQASDDAAFADVMNPLGQALLFVGRIALARELYRRAESLWASGVRLKNPGDMLFNAALVATYAGELAQAEEIAQRHTAIAAERSAHARTHNYGLRALLALARGDWQGVTAMAAEVTRTVDSHPGVAFCLVGGSAVTYDATTAALAGQRFPDRAVELLDRTVTESEPLRASLLLLPRGAWGWRELELEMARRAWAPDERSWDRNIVDPFRITEALALVMLERWDDLDPVLERLDELGRGGGKLGRALAAAVREERAAGDGPAPRHRELRELGYLGFSQLLSFRPRPDAGPVRLG
jgi:tetratricopeptide (TPR) repeat protein